MKNDFEYDNYDTDGKIINRGMTSNLINKVKEHLYNNKEIIFIDGKSDLNNSFVEKIANENYEDYEYDR